MVKQMVNLLRRLRRGMVEKRVVRACLFSSVQGRKLYEMMTEYMKNSDGEEDETDGHGNAMETEVERIMVTANVSRSAHGSS